MTVIAQKKRENSAYFLPKVVNLFFLNKANTHKAFTTLLIN